MFSDILVVKDLDINEPMRFKLRKPSSPKGFCFDFGPFLGHTFLPQALLIRKDDAAPAPEETKKARDDDPK